MPGSPKWSLSFNPTPPNPVYASLLPRMGHMPLPSPSSWFYHPNNVSDTTHPSYDEPPIRNLTNFNLAPMFVTGYNVALSI
jgi:hypothetical protein